MFGKKTKELQRRVAWLDAKVEALEAREETVRFYETSRSRELFDMRLRELRGVDHLQKQYTALLEKLGLEEVEIKAGIKLVEKKP